MTLTFDAATHTYRIDGAVVPSVTQLLRPMQNFDGIDPAVLEAKRELGTFVHKACELDDEDDLDEDSLDPVILGYVQGWRKFKRETGALVLQSERQLCNRALGFAGTLDRVAELHHLNAPSRWLLDIKTSAEIDAWVGVQLAGYRLLLESNGDHVDALAAVQLFPDGKYALYRFGHPDDVRCFMSLLSIHHWKTKNVR